MKLFAKHDWNVSIDEAKCIQTELAKKVILSDQFSRIRFVAGVDVGFENNNQVTRAAIAVLRYPELELYETSLARLPTVFPYIPGYLSFREVPAVLKALEKIKQLPDILLCDGQGIAHPRRFGIACHLGVLTDLPAIGVAKSRLIGTHNPVPEQKGQSVDLYDHDEKIGCVLRTRTNVKPLYISPGHRVSLVTSKDIVMSCVSKYRLPETTRYAHRLASQMK